MVLFVMKLNYSLICLTIYVVVINTQVAALIIHILLRLGLHS